MDIVRGRKIVSKEETIDFILVQDDVYYAFVDEAETKGMVPVNVSLLLTLRVVNPYKALYRVQHWLEATQNRIKPAFRSFVALKEFEELTKQREAVEEELNSFLRGTKVDEFISDNYGVELVAVEIVRIDPAGEWAAKFAEAATKKWLAEKTRIKLKFWQTLKFSVWTGFTEKSPRTATLVSSSALLRRWNRPVRDLPT